MILCKNQAFQAYSSGSEATRVTSVPTAKAPQSCVELPPRPSSVASAAPRARSSPVEAWEVHGCPSSNVF